MFTSTRIRLTAWYVGALALFLLALGTAVYQLEEHQLRTNVDHGLHVTADRVEAKYKKGGFDAASATTYGASYNVSYSDGSRRACAQQRHSVEPPVRAGRDRQRVGHAHDRAPRGDAADLLAAAEPLAGRAGGAVDGARGGCPPRPPGVHAVRRRREHRPRGGRRLVPGRQVARARGGGVRASAGVRRRRLARAADAAHGDPGERRVPAAGAARERGGGRDPGRDRSARGARRLAARARPRPARHGRRHRARSRRARVGLGAVDAAARHRPQGGARRRDRDRARGARQRRPAAPAGADPGGQRPALHAGGRARARWTPTATTAPRWWR